MASAKPPGRLGDPTMAPGTDPRTNPCFLPILKAFAMDKSSIPESAPTRKSPPEDIEAFMTQSDEGIRTMYSMMDYNIPALASPVKVTRSEEYATAPDGHKVKLIIYRPAEASSTPLPAVVYIHGGGMAILDTESVVHMSWIETLAKQGLVAIAVDFRNAWTKEGHNPFPTGLNDCAAAVQWIHAHKEQLGITKIIVHGESGGGNLSIATTLKAKKEGWLDAISGVAAFIPYISGAYGMSDEWKLQNLPSLIECDGYFISGVFSDVLVNVYDPDGKDAKNPLAWPYWAEEEDLKGLPPHMIYINELDPLRDEGAIFYRKLAAAGVRVSAKMTLGALHGAEWIFRHAVPDQFLSNVADIKAFADRV